MRRIVCAFSAFLIAFWLATPSEAAAPFRDGTHRFKEKARQLSDSFAKETRMEADLRLRGQVACADTKPPSLGDEVAFFIDRKDTGKTDTLPAILRSVGNHCYVYVEKGQEVSAETIKKLVDYFDNRIYPTDRAWFGSEWTPGIDNDPRITLFLVSGMKNMDGFFNPEDEYTREKCETSNEREMLYLATERLATDFEDFMACLVSHEFHHMIHWHHDPKEANWIEEGLAEFAGTLFGRVNFTVGAYLQHPDRCLIDWDDTVEASNYGNVLLFTRYLVTQCASGDVARQKLVQALVNNRQIGIAGVVSALKECGINTSFEEIFHHFCIATFWNTAFSPESGVFAFDTLLMNGLKDEKNNPLKPARAFKTVGGTVKGKVKMWSAKVYTCKVPAGQQPLVVSFKGKTFKARFGENIFDVGVGFIESGENPSKIFQWLRVKDNATEQAIPIPHGKYDRMWVFVVNREPGKHPANEKTWPAIPFQLSIEEIPIASAAGTSSTTRPPRRRAEIRSLLEDLAIAPTSGEERLILESVRDELHSGLGTTREELADLLENAPQDQRQNLSALEQKIRDVIRFEGLQER